MLNTLAFWAGIAFCCVLAAGQALYVLLLLARALGIVS